MKPLKVWRWSGWEDNATQTHEIMAASSKAEVARAANVTSPSRLWNLTVTANQDDVAQAMSEPGAVFWHPSSEDNSRLANQKPRWRKRLAPSKYGPGKIR